MTIDDRVSLNIKDIRRFRGLSQETLAIDSGVSHGYMGRLENAKQSMTLLKLETIASALHVDPVFLLLPRHITQDQLLSFVSNNGGTIEVISTAIDPSSR